MAFKRAIVTAVGPLRILIDGDTVPIPFTPKSLIDPATLTVGDVVHADQSGHRLVVLGRAGGLGLLSGRNLFINSNFMVNQRGAASGALIADSAYFLDRWFNPSFGTTSINWADSGGVRTLILGFSDAVRWAAQIVEASTLPAGTYTVSWEGTAELYIFALNPSYENSPVTFTTDGTTDVKFQFRGNGDTLRNVKLERGSVATPYLPPTYDDNLQACERYYLRIKAASISPYGRIAQGFASTTTRVIVQVPLGQAMRIDAPTVSSSGPLAVWDGVTSTSLTSLAMGQGSTRMVELWCNSTSLTVHRPYFVLADNDAAAFIAFSAEL